MLFMGDVAIYVFLHHAPGLPRFARNDSFYELGVFSTW